MPVIFLPELKSQNQIFIWLINIWAMTK